MSDLALRRIEDKLNALIPKAEWLLSNYSSAGTGPCPPCAGEEAAAETVPVFTLLDEEYWPFRDDETSLIFLQKLKQPEFIHFFKSQGLEKFHGMVKINPALTAANLRLMILGTGKQFKTSPENLVDFGTSETAKPLLVYTPETYVQLLQNPSKDLEEERFEAINVFIKQLIFQNLDVYKPFAMDKTKFANLYAIFQNLYKVLQGGGCNSNKVYQNYLISKNIKDAAEETANIKAAAKQYFDIDRNLKYQARQRKRRKSIRYVIDEDSQKYEPFEDFNEWNWVENDLNAAQLYYAQSARNNLDLYPFSSFQEWKNEFDMRTGGPMTTRNESLAAAKHYRDGGGINETYPQETLKEWNDTKIASEGPRVILPSKEIPQTPDWCFVALTSLFTQHPYVINYFKNKETPIEIPDHVSKTLLKKQSSVTKKDANEARNELSGKVIFSVLLNFVTTYKPLEALLPQIIAGEITDPSSYDLFAAYLQQKPLPKTPPEFMQPQQADTATQPYVTASEETLPSSEIIPNPVGSTSTVVPKLNSLQLKELKEKGPTLAKQLKQLRQPQATIEIETEGKESKPLTSYTSPSSPDFGGLRLRRRRKPTRRHYTKSPIRPFY